MTLLLFLFLLQECPPTDVVCRAAVQYSKQSQKCKLLLDRSDAAYRTWYRSKNVLDLKDPNRTEKAAKQFSTLLRKAANCIEKESNLLRKVRARFANRERVP